MSLNRRKNKTSLIDDNPTKKKKQRLNSDKKKQTHEQKECSSTESISLTKKIDASKHPEYIRFLNQLGKSENERTQKAKVWKSYEQKSLNKWYTAERKQAWDDFYSTKNKIREDLANEVEAKISKLRQELDVLTQQSIDKCIEVQQDNDGLGPLNYFSTICSIIGDVRNDENNNKKSNHGTPNLVYSDQDSCKSVVETPEENELLTISKLSNTTIQKHNEDDLKIINNNKKRQKSKQKTTNDQQVDNDQKQKSNQEIVSDQQQEIVNNQPQEFNDQQKQASNSQQQQDIDQQESSTSQLSNTRFNRFTSMLQRKFDWWPKSS